MCSVCGFEGTWCRVSEARQAWQKKNARVAQLVEYDLAKVGAAGSSPVSRSLKPLIFQGFFVFVLHFVLHDENHCMKFIN